MSRGFTLIELIFVVAVVALLMSVGAPSFQTAVKNSQMRESANNLIASLQLARSEALKRRVPVTVCPSLDSSTCAEAPWHSGWIVSALGELIYAEEAMPGRVNVTLPADQQLQDSLTYLPNGFPSLGGLDAAGVMILCDDRQSNYYGRIIVISQTGRPVIAAANKRDDLDIGDRCE